MVLPAAADVLRVDQLVAVKQRVGFGGERGHLAGREHVADDQVAVAFILANLIVADRRRIFSECWHGMPVEELEIA